MSLRSRLPVDAIAVLALTGVGCRTPESTASAAPPPAIAHAHTDETSLATVTLTPEADARLGITVTAVERRSLPEVRRLPGEVVARPGGVVTLAAPVAGLVIAADGLPRPGAVIAQNQPIARLVPLAAVDRDLRAQAVSRVAAAQARWTAGNSRALRAERLIESGAGSERGAEDARVERDIAAAELEAAKARLRMIDRTPLASDVATTLRAPMAAVVRQVFVADGQSVAGAAPLVELVTTEPPWLRVPVTAAELGLLDDATAEVTPLGGAGPAIVATRVAGPPTADPLAGSVDLYFALADAAGLRLGERVSVALERKRDGESLVVPASAVIHDLAGGTWVYGKLGEHRYARRRIELSRMTGDLALVARGLEVGEQIVTAGGVELYGTEFGAGH